MGAFRGKNKSKALMVCDGAKSYGVLEERHICSVAIGRNAGFYRKNEVNGYHNFIKERNRSARGFGAMYLNRYNALFSWVYRGNDFLVDELYKTIFQPFIFGTGIAVIVFAVGIRNRH